MSETVFVIGAGSSIDIVGDAFPSGPQLLQQIGELLVSPGPERRRPRDAQMILEVCAASLGGDINRFLEVSRRILPLTETNASIDQLITFANDEQLSMVAKICIGYIIGCAESQFALHSRPNWIFQFLREYLARARTLEQAREKLARLSFVVFNYDRIVEATIFSFLRNKFELKPELALQLLAEVNIRHPYGQLAPFSLAASPDALPVPFEHFKANFPRVASQIARTIRTFDESIDEAIPAKVRSAVDVAKSLVFVGFGFGDENLDLIAPKDNQGPTKSIYATRYDINERRWGNLETALLQRLTPSTNPGKQSARREIYDRGRIQSVQTCSDLVSHYSLEW